MSGLIMTISSDDEEDQKQQQQQSSSELSAEQKRQQRLKSNKLAASMGRSATSDLSLADEIADAEDEEEFEMTATNAPTAPSEQKKKKPDAKSPKSKATKRKAAAANLSDAEDDDDDDDDEEDATPASSFEWDGDDFGSPSAASSSAIPAPSQHFQPYVQPSRHATSLQQKIEAQLAKNKQSKKEKKTKEAKTDGDDEEEDEEMDGSDAEDEEADGSDGDDESMSDADAAASDSDADDEDEDEVDASVNVHSYKDDGDAIRPKKPSSSNGAAGGPKVINATPLAVQNSLQTIHDFASLKLSRPLLRGVNEIGWHHPTPVQAACILPAVGGKDMLVNAVTGSGKTGAFMLPILERLLYRPKRVALTRVLVLLPTRELAAQCMEVSQQLAKYTDIRFSLIVGGLSEKVQQQELRNKPDVVLATPGRLIDHLRNTQNVHLEDIEILVLDEADRLLDLGFAEELREIIKECPVGRQTLLFSATLTATVIDLVDLSLRNPVRVKIDEYESIVDRLKQEFIRIRDPPGSNRMSRSEKEKATEKEREAIVLALAKRSFQSRTIIFAQSKQSCHRLNILFGLANLRATELQGNMTQLQRLESLEKFRSGQVDFLLCTDLASRGIDIPNVATVINVSMPRELRQYIHRVGRTARAGKEGRACTLVGEGQRSVLKELLKKARDVVQSRVIPPNIIQKYREVIAQMEDDIRAIFSAEAEEKSLRLTEMEANRLANRLRFEEEIHSRPAKTWFQTQQEKQAAKERAPRQFSTADDGADNDDSKLPSSKSLKAQSISEAEELKKLKQKEKKKDPLLGLSRAKKRRKLMRMEEEKLAKQAQAEARKHDANDLRSQVLPQPELPLTLSASEKIQRLAGHRAKKDERASKLAALGVTDEKERRREKQAMEALKNEKKRKSHDGMDGRYDVDMMMDDGDGSGSKKKKKQQQSDASGSFRFQPWQGSGDSRFKLPARKLKEERSQRAKGEASALAAQSGETKKKGVKKSNKQFKSKARYKRR